MGVQGGKTTAVVNQQMKSIACGEMPNQTNRPVKRHPDWRSLRHAQVTAGMPFPRTCERVFPIPKLGGHHAPAVSTQWGYKAVHVDEGVSREGYTRAPVFTSYPS